jgi:outer membrane receptor protein involved in Fe transport
MRLPIFLFLFAAAVAPAVPGQQEPATSPTPPSTAPRVEETIQVTATRIPEEILDLPASVTVIPGVELEERGVTDLAGALALAAGVSIAPGGDGGPAASVPELMGLRELDAFLLVVDGVPWGGAFNPALSTLDLTNVDRVEVLRGAAPVLYGATSFVGVIHGIHRAPADTPRAVEARGGSYGSFGAAVTAPLAGGARLRQSLSASFDRQGYQDDRTGFDRGHALWSATGPVGGGTLRFSLDLAAVRQDPASPHPRQGRGLSPLVPLDANHNPWDARIDEDRFHFVTGYDHRLGAADWTTTLALTHTQRDTTRGFLRADFEVPPGVSNADGFRQDFSGDDLYFDTHFALHPDEDLAIVTGVDLLAGRGTADSDNFEYHVALDGSGAPSSRSLHVDESPHFEDERRFAGAYVQTLWTPAPRWKIDAGLRLNSTREKQDGKVAIEDGEEVSGDSRSDTRLSGSLGASFLAWGSGSDALWVYADYKDAFKPAAVDFGPEAEGEILDPETAQTVEAGLKGSHAGGRLTWQASIYRMDFDNLVVAQVVDGLPALENAGTERFEGFEIEGRWRLLDALTVEGSYAHHSAKFRDYLTEFDGVPTQLAGKKLEMSPDELAGLGLTWAPERGLNAWLAGNYVGERWLNKRNTALADSYTTLAAGLGWRFAQWSLRLDGWNLTGERPPVAESELGDAQYYRLPARSFTATARCGF